MLTDFRGCPLPPIKNFRRAEEETYQEKVAAVDGVQLRVIKRMENHSVALLSIFASAEPLGESKRNDKKQKMHNGSMPCPCPQM